MTERKAIQQLYAASTRLYATYIISKVDDNNLYTGGSWDIFNNNIGTCDIDTKAR